MIHPSIIGIQLLWVCFTFLIFLSIGCGIPPMPRRTVFGSRNVALLSTGSHFLHYHGWLSRIQRLSPRRLGTPYWWMAGMDTRERSIMLVIFSLWETLPDGPILHANRAKAVTWGLITGFNSPFPWFYAAFFTPMILHRAWRDLQRCHSKYGEAWEEYERQVPYLFIPVSRASVNLNSILQLTALSMSFNYPSSQHNFTIVSHHLHSVEMITRSLWNIPQLRCGSGQLHVNTGCSPQTSLLADCIKISGAVLPKSSFVAAHTLQPPWSIDRVSVDYRKKSSQELLQTKQSKEVGLQAESGRL